MTNEAKRWLVEQLVGEGIPARRAMSLIKSYDDYDSIHEGTKRILYGGVWTDGKGNMFNCHGKRIGYIQWEEGFGDYREQQRERERIDQEEIEKLKKETDLFMKSLFRDLGIE